MNVKFQVRCKAGMIRTTLSARIVRNKYGSGRKYGDNGTTDCWID